MYTKYPAYVHEYENCIVIGVVGTAETVTTFVGGAGFAITLSVMDRLEAATENLAASVPPRTIAMLIVDKTVKRLESNTSIRRGIRVTPLINVNVKMSGGRESVSQGGGWVEKLITD